jgi:hypothetical protein
MFGRFWVAAQTADCGLDDDESARILSTDDAAFGEEDGDYPPPVKHDDVHSSTIEETLDYYDQHQRYNDITILEDEDD